MAQHSKVNVKQDSEKKKQTNCSKQKKNFQSSPSYHKLSDDLWFTNSARLRNSACL